MESAHEVDITLAIEKLEDQDAWRRAAARKICLLYTSDAADE